MTTDKLETLDLAELENVTGGVWYWQNGRWIWKSDGGGRNRGVNASGRGDTANRRR